MRIVLVATLLWACAQFAHADDPHLRILAASCAACHGTAGNSVGGTPVLAGLDRTYFIAQMQAFQAGTRPATVMQKHVKGLTDAEIEQLADYFAAQPRTGASAVHPLGDM